MFSRGGRRLRRYFGFYHWLQSSFYTQVSFHLGHKRPRLNRFKNIAIEPGGQTPFFVAHHGERRYRHEGNFSQFRIGLHSLGELIAIEPGHLDVAQDEFRVFALNGSQAGLTILCGQRCVPIGF